MALNKISMQDGKEFYYIDKNTFEYCYNEIFKDKIYIKRGIDIKKGDVIFDIGANMGLFSVFANDLVKDLQIHAFEPVPQICDCAKKNLEKYPNTVLNNFGLGEKEQDLEFFYYPKNTGNSTAVKFDYNLKVKMILDQWDEIAEKYDPRLKKLPKFLRKPFITRLAKKTYVTEKVKCKIRPLSAYIQENNIQRIDMMKLDAENYEKHVLAGLAENDWDKIQQIAMEVHTHIEGEDKLLDEMTALLEQKGFKTFQGDPSMDTMVGVFMLYGKRM